MFLGILDPWNSGLLRYVKIYAFPKKKVSDGSYSGIQEITLSVCTTNMPAGGDDRGVCWDGMPRSSVPVFLRNL